MTQYNDNGERLEWPMELRSTRERIRTVAQRYKEYHPNGIILWDGTNSNDIHSELAKFDDETATPADIERIIGVDWIRISCTQCLKTVPAAVQLGEEPDYESSTATICRECLVKALALIDGEIAS